MHTTDPKPNNAHAHCTINTLVDCKFCSVFFFPFNAIL